MRIRSDLEGVVYVPGDDGELLCLAAGDDVPRGVDVGEHLTTEPAEPAEAPDETETKRAGNSRGRSSATRA